MRNAVALFALAGVAGTAAAVETQIILKVRQFGTSDPWVSSANFVSPNLVDPIELEVGAFYTRETGYGLSTVIHSITGSPFSGANGDTVTILDDNPTSTLHPDGRQGNFNFGGQFQVVYHTGTSGVDANRFRIASSGNPNDVAAGGISVKQGTPIALGTNFDTSNPAYGYHFKLTLACYNGGQARLVTITAPDAKINSFTVYSSASSTTATNIKTSLVPTSPALVTVSWVPSPPSVALLGAGAMIAARRRR